MGPYFGISISINLNLCSNWVPVLVFLFLQFESGLKLRFRIVNPADAGQFPENKSKMQISFNQGNKYDQSKNHKVLTKFHSKNHKLISNTK